MTSNLAPITGKLGKMIRMLASDCDGDVIAAARAIKRSLRSEGLDIHELAKAIEEPNGGTLTEAEMRKLYDAGYDAGLRAAEDKHHGAADFANVDVRRPGTRSRCGASNATSACARKSASSSATWRRARSGASRPRSRASGSRASSTGLGEGGHDHEAAHLQRRPRAPAVRACPID